MEIVINGMKISTSRSGNISIVNDTVYVDGKSVKLGDSKDIKIEGNCGTIKCNGNVQVSGNVNGNIDCGDSCHCGDVEGSIDAGGSVTAKNAKANIDAGGSVHICKCCGE